VTLDRRYLGPRYPSGPTPPLLPGAGHPAAAPLVPCDPARETTADRLGLPPQIALIDPREANYSGQRGAPERATARHPEVLPERTAPCTTDSADSSPH
jgi:hypothetical protein